MSGPSQSWDPKLYDDRHAFVHEYGASLIEMLAPRPGERVLDLGCGTGHLTAVIAAHGAQVIGIDASPQMIERARLAYPHIAFQVGDATRFDLGAPFDAVFSNAALHWIKPPEAVVYCIARALLPGGRLVAELGGQGNVRQILDACRTAVRSLAGHDVGDVNPWFFPSVAVYAAMLEREGLEVRRAELFDRPTALEDGPRGMRNWLTMFAAPCFESLSEPLRPTAMDAAEELLRPALYRDGQWTADYRRLRIAAVKA